MGKGGGRKGRDVLGMGVHVMLKVGRREGRGG